MMELIGTIALLCTLSGGGSSEEIYKEQLKCQQDYLICVKGDRRSIDNGAKLERCVIVNKRGKNGNYR